MNALQWQKIKSDPVARERKREYDRKRYADKKYPHRESQAKLRLTVRGRAMCLIRGARQRANARGIEFSLQLEWVIERLERGTCEVSGLPFVLTALDGRKDPFTPSIDRRETTGGYTPENCRMVLWAVNVAMADFGEATYLRIAAACLKAQEISH